MNIKEYDRQLNAHDWHYSFSDDIKVYRHGSDFDGQLEAAARLSPQHQMLWEAYRVHRGQRTPKLTDQPANLDAVRVLVGVLTAAELKAIAQADSHRINEEALRKRKKLETYNWKCHAHNWFYWKERTDSPHYQTGLRVRTELLQGLSATMSREKVLQDPSHWAYQTTQLFCAYADHANGVPGGWDRLRALLDELGLARGDAEHNQWRREQDEQ